MAGSSPRPKHRRALHAATTRALAALSLRVALTAAALFVASPRAAIAAPPTAPAAATITEHLGAKLPLDARFRDETGKTVRLGDYFHDRGGRPVLLGLMYHRCAMLCSVVLDGTVKGLRDVGWSVGDQFDVVTISIDPKDEPAIAEKKRNQILARYGRPSAARGWHFLVGDEPSIRAVTSAVGFGFVRDPATSAIAHPAAILFVTPDARVSRYLYGVEFPKRDLELSLWGAAEGRLLGTREKLILACWHFDAHARGYVLVARGFLRVGAALVLVALTGVLLLLLVRDRARRRAEEALVTTPSTK